jgi:uncharacterized protein YacL (UPF0231 family)
MRTNIFLVLVSLTLLLDFDLTAQNPQNQNMQGQQGQALFFDPNYRPTKQQVNIEGTPFIQSSFEPIKVIGYEDKNYQGRYNAFKDEMEIQLDPERLIALDNSKQYEVHFKKSNTIYRTYSFFEGDDLKRGFFVVLFEDSNVFAVLKKEKIKFIDEVKAQSSYERDQEAKFNRLNDEYFLFINNEVINLPNNKNKIAKAFPEIGSKIKSFIKSNSLSLKEEADFIKIAKFIVKNTP